MQNIVYPLETKRLSLHWQMSVYDSHPCNSLGNCWVINSQKCDLNGFAFDPRNYTVRIDFVGNRLFERWAQPANHLQHSFEIIWIINSFSLRLSWSRLLSFTCLSLFCLCSHHRIQFVCVWVSESVSIFFIFHHNIELSINRFLKTLRFRCSFQLRLR